MLHSLFLIGSFGTSEMLLIAFALILLFGAKKIPELFRGMGQGVREFKDASKVEETQQPQYRDQPGQQPNYNQQPGYNQPQQPNYNQPQQPNGYPQQTGYQQPTPPAYNPNDPTNQPR